MLENTIEAVLHTYKPLMGEDYLRYRNHVYRVYHNCLILDPNVDNSLKYALAAVFHDIGIWTDNTFDYITPSIAKAREFVQRHHAGVKSDEISTMIEWHHKISKYTGPHSPTTECFRKADWIDVTLGLSTFGHPRSDFERIRRQYPSHGFHRFLFRETVLNTWRHPLNPLPMFRR
jgi:hypothetical protein